MDKNITIPKQEIAPGVFTKGGTATVPAGSPSSNILTAQTLQPVQPIPVLPQPTIDTGASAVAGAETQTNDFQTNYQNYLNQINQQTPEKTSFDNLLKEFTTASENTLGQGQTKLQAEQQAGLPAKYQERAGVQGQIKTGIAEYNRLKAEYDAQKANIEAGAGRKGLTTGAVMGQQGAVQRAAESALNAKAADIQILQAQDQALAGDIEAAQNTVNRAVDLMYKDREAVLALKRDQLNIAKEFLSEADKKRAEAREFAYKKEEAKIAEEKANAKTIQTMLLEATPNAPANIIANAKNIADNGGSALEVAQALGKYGGDYLKTELLKQQIETEKAQRSNYLASAAKTRTETDLLKGEGGQYTEKQKKAITKLNEDVSKNATYAKTTAMRGYADNVAASLSQGTGTGDLAAINQFQKVIDEGAVTRDQDVKLIQQSQSLLDSIKTKANRLAKGEQLSPELRQQMRTSVEALYDAQIKALNKDPYIKAKTTEAGLYGLKDTDTILGELGGFTVGGSVSPADNKFGQSLGPVMSKIPGTTIINQVKPDGSLDFILPTNQLTR